MIVVYSPVCDHSNKGKCLPLNSSIYLIPDYCVLLDFITAWQPRLNDTFLFICHMVFFCINPNILPIIKDFLPTNFWGINVEFRRIPTGGVTAPGVRATRPWCSPARACACERRASRSWPRAVPLNQSSETNSNTQFCQKSEDKGHIIECEYTLAW